MDGLEAVEIRLSEVVKNKDFRIDSPFWTTTIFKNPTIKYRKIGEILLTSQYGVSTAMNEENKGFPIYRMNEIHNMLCDFQVNKFADLASLEADTFKLNNKDVLFNRTNSYEWVGRTGIFYKNTCTDFIFASYLVRFVPNEAIIKAEYLATFLNTKYGVKAIKSRARQSINQTNVNPEEVKEIFIPLINAIIQQKIVDCFEKANICLLKSYNLYTSAENLLLSHLGLLDYAPSKEPVAIKSFSSSFGTSGRFDSEYYQPKYEEIEGKLNCLDTVQSICVLHDKNYEPSSEIEYQYIELSNIGNSGDIKNTEKTLGVELPTRARRCVKKGQVIISSIEGSLNSCALITDEYDEALCSTGFYVITSKKYNPETLLLLFKSEPMQALMKKRCSGTILTAVNKDEFLALPLPILEQSIQIQIAEKIQQSFALRKQSKELLELAKTAVEVAIEQGEDKALELLADIDKD